MYEKGERTSGEFLIHLASAQFMKVWCEFDDSHGWIVIQKRQDGTVDFDKDWNQYSFGFGKVNSEFWLGM